MLTSENERKRNEATMTDGQERGQKPTKYYIDFENVHGPGLKGVDQLGEHDEVFVFYSQAAETFHIEQAVDILKSKARVEFVEIDGGTRNSLDFQLVAALFGTMDDEHDYAIVSGDGGFDAAIKMGKRLELPDVRRITDLTGSTESPQAKSTRTRRSRQSGTAKKQEQAKQSKNAEQQDQEAAGKPEAAPQKLPAGKKQEQLPAPTPAPAPETPGDTADGADAQQQEHAPAERSGRYSKRKEIKALLADNGVTLNQQQLSSVMKALNGVKNKQGFYRSIIQAEKQERGLDLYRQVRDHYDTMVEILRS